MNDWVIHKFGGSCLRIPGDLEQIHHRLLTCEGRPLIVVSALWGVTDRLIRAIREPWQWSNLVNDLRRQHLRFTPGLEEEEAGLRFKHTLEKLSGYLLDLCQESENELLRNSILACGERLSSIVVAEALRRRGFDCAAVESDELGLVISENGAEIDLPMSSVEIKRTLLEPRTPVVSGWFGNDSSGRVRVLDRGGSDLSAAALATILEARRIILWKDVPGVLSVSPRWGIDSQTIPYLGQEEALALARAGGVVLHAACIEPLLGTGIPLEIRPLHLDGVFTTIGPDIETADRRVSAISCTPGIIQYSIHTSGIDTASKFNSVMGLIREEAVRVWVVKVSEGHIMMFVPASLSTKLDLLLESMDSTFEKSVTGSLISLIGQDIIHQRNDAIASIDERYASHFLTDEPNLNQLVKELVAQYNLAC
ncbi:MAG: hypothetical protein QF707_08240 [Candidatus Poseidoniaceae archaeon]|nr:hypothetical protein [Candidatus Poseidoniaceae archaeon]MDP7202830.1 hypothetical protein [Candidatus Poseidoniaceae archaeon]